MSLVQLFSPQRESVLAIEGVAKSFGKVQALKEISFELFSGEVLALVGDNGAGKSTLIKILSGVYEPDRGFIRVDGLKFKHLSPALAIKHGIATVYQDLALVDSHDCPGNVFLGREPLKAGLFVDRKKMADDTAQLIKKLKLSIPSLASPVGELSGGQRQGVAIARTVSLGGKVIILDEPTAAMGVKESQQVLDVVKELAGQGYAVLIVSHNLHHVFAIADRICVMRQGSLVGDMAASDTNPDEIVRLITGLDNGANGVNIQAQ